MTVYGKPSIWDVFNFVDKLYHRANILPTLRDRLLWDCMLCSQLLENEKLWSNNVAIHVHVQHNCVLGFGFYLEGIMIKKVQISVHIFLNNYTFLLRTYSVNLLQQTKYQCCGQETLYQLLVYLWSSVILATQKVLDLTTLLIVVSLPIPQ